MKEVLLIIMLFLMAVGAIGLIMVSWIVYEARYEAANKRKKK